MEELIKTKDTGYAEYEDLLIQKDSIIKKGELYRLAYVREFGELTAEVFRTQIECIAKKKKIAWCTARANRNQEINAAELDAYITAVMQEYYDQLDDMIAERKAAEDTKTVSPFEMQKIKEIYRHLAKLIHPDRRPDLAGDETIKELWERISLAYRYNRLKELEELKFRTEMYLAALGDDDTAFEITDLEEKIASLCEEINTLLSSLPYTYRFLLDDEQEKEDRRKELGEQLKSYTAYSKELDEVLAQFDIKRSFS